MSRDAPWLSAPAFAELVGINRRNAMKALAKAVSGIAWRCHCLTVRTVDGRGGRAGLRYEVALSSLPEALQRAYWEDLGNDFQGPDATAIVAVASPVVGCGYVPAPNQSETVAYRWRVIQEAVEAPPRSIERKAEVVRAAKKWDQPVRTIYGWIKRLEDAGGDMNALARKRPADAGARRVGVSRVFDAAWIAAGHDPAELLGLGDALDHQIKRAWASARRPLRALID